MPDPAAPSGSIREFRAENLDEVVALWHRTKTHAYPYLPLEQARTLDEDRAFFRDSILARCRVWVWTDSGAIRGFIALEGGAYVDRLYVDPLHQRRGIGRALMREAAGAHPGPLRLHTHQKNLSACAFYEGLGLRPVQFGVSPAPECEPDVEYAGRPFVTPPGDAGTSSETWFSAFAARIDAARTDLEIAFLVRVLPLPEFARILDVPCGLGRHARRLAERGYRVTGCDVSAAVVDATRAVLRGQGDVVRADLRDLAACGGSFDAVVNLWQSFGMFDDATNAAVLAEMAQRVRPGGRVVVDVYDLDRFEPVTGVRKRVRPEGEVSESSEFTDGRLRVRLSYSWSQATDAFEWRLYRRAEFRDLALAAGLSLVAIGEDFGMPPTADPGVPRVQYVLERSPSSPVARPH